MIRAANRPDDGALRDPAACLEALRLFRVAVPEHSAAEEEILFPRVRRRLSPERRRLIDALEEEHGCAERAHGEVERLMELWLANGRLSSTAKARLAAVLEGLNGLYRRHIQAEENDVFPVIAQLPPEDRDQLGVELARR
jgi:hemerythrin-like domain-containing protein